MIQANYKHIFTMLKKEIERPDSVDWFDWRDMKQDVDKILSSGHGEDLHTEMQRFYRCYLWRDLESRAAWSFMDYVAERDEYFGRWATDEKIDIIELTERWIELRNSRTLQALLTKLGQTGYETDWQKVRSEMNEKLLRMEVEGTRYGTKETGYFYCLLHAFAMIMSSDYPSDERARLLEQFSEQWSFLRTVYSVMVRRIVGLNFTNFAQLAQYTVGGQQEFDPFLHLFHAPLKERFEDLVGLGTKRESLDKAIVKIEQRMHGTKPCHDLDALCETLFPDEFRNMLNRQRHPSYREMESELDRIKAELNDTQETLNRQAREMATQLKCALEASVSIDLIEQRMLIFQSSIALNIYSWLNTMLQVDAVWQAHSENILQKILAKQQQELQLSMNITAQPGSNVNGIVQQQTNTAIAPNHQIPSA